MRVSVFTLCVLIVLLSGCDDVRQESTKNLREDSWGMTKAVDPENGVTCYRMERFDGIYCFSPKELQ